MPRQGNNEVLQRVAGISFRRACLNIEGVWDRCTPSDIESGANWYGAAGAIVQDIGALSGDAPETVASVVAQLSPRTAWDRNVAGAYALCVTGQRATGIMHGNYDRAAATMVVGRNGGDPVATINGPKTNAFARNILGDREAVTIDVHAARIALDPNYRRGGAGDVERIVGRAGAYVALANAYRVVAARIGVDPTTLQAATWIRQRNGRAA